MRRFSCVRGVAALAAGALLLAAAPASAQDPSGSAAPATSPAAACDTGGQAYKIGSMIWNTSIPFYSNLIKGEQEQGAKYGITVDVQSGNGDIATEVAVIQQFISQRVDLILVSPSDAQGIVPVIQQANLAGIPVIEVNSTVGDEAETVTYVGADDFMFGQMQGELLKQALPDGGKVGYILGHLGVSAQILRQDGLKDALKDVTNIAIVAEQSADWDNAKALAITQDWLNRYPLGQLDAIVDQGPEGATAAQYAHDNGRSEIKFLMGDYPADVKAGIEAGYIYGTVDQDPYPQGTTALDMACLVLTGRTAEVPTPHVYLALPIVTKDNVADYPAAWGG
jgi:ABC-type sugar transport system substrate-binding protein